MIGGLIGQTESLFRRATGSKAADFWLTKRHEDFPWFCLVGVIADGKTDESGHVTHEVLKIGKGLANVAVARGGYLYGYANDAWNFYTNNRGSVQLTVTRLS